MQEFRGVTYPILLFSFYCVSSGSLVGVDRLGEAALNGCVYFLELNFKYNWEQYFLLRVIFDFLPLAIFKINQGLNRLRQEYLLQRLPFCLHIRRGGGMG